MPIKAARSEHEAAAQAERVATLRREAARTRLDEARCFLDAAKREAAEPGGAVRKGREGDAA